ncbi:MarR family transcriptional regulator [Erythrobacter sp. SAORIC-644]|jgi:DNA-binding MarR family transcriptional regulator|nr:MarR family transcriptional regulator [Erythrobacter sp. SAORIC-644]QPL39568.1 MarR family transcriptional regulator [Erythrobacter sp. A30-3]|tara:strand:+ start:72 stop:590 length:519 start_codon:yes stop_codon:yes gene_type:complete
MSSRLPAKADEDCEGRVGGYGAFALGGRLRRLSDRIDRDAKSIYEKMGVEFEQRWFPVFNCLRGGEALSVTEISDRLGISHVSVSVTRKSLEAAGLVTSTQDKSDGRRSVLALTSRGETLSMELGPLFAALDLAAADLNADAGNAITAIERLEKALDTKSLSERAGHFLKES